MKIAFVTKHDFIKECKSGGNVLSKQIFSILQDIVRKDNINLIILGSSSDKVFSHNVEKIYLDINPIRRNLDYLVLRDGYNKKTEMKIRHRLKVLDADIFFFDGTWFGKISKYIPKSKKVIVFYHNIEKELSWDRVKKGKSIVGLPRYFSNWYNEKMITERADVRICMNKRDNNLLVKHYNKTADEFLPLFCEDTLQNIKRRQQCNRELLFVGSYFYPNVEGIRWFCRNVMPEIDAKLKIVGNGMECLRSELTKNNIDVIGKVESLEEYYDECDAVVMPIFSGGGMKVKTAEALMRGKIIFATREALEGYEKGDIYECNSKYEFINNINKYYLENQYTAYSYKNRKLYEDHYSLKSAKFKLNFILERYL